MVQIALHRQAVVIFDDRASNVLDRTHTATLPYGHLKRFDIGDVSGPERAVRGASRFDDVLDRQVVQSQVVLAHQHLILWEFATDDRDLRYSGDR